MAGEESIDEILNKKDALGPKELLIEELKGYGNSDVNNLAIELYENLSKDKIEESRELIDQFFKQFYSNVSDDVEFETEQPPKEEPKEVQVTFKEELK